MISVLMIIAEKKIMNILKKIILILKEKIKFKNNNINKSTSRYKYLPYLNEIINNSKKMLFQGINIIIDETVVLFHGRLNMVFQIPSKPNKWGFKIHNLMDINIHYINDMIMFRKKLYKLNAQDTKINLNDNLLIPWQIDYKENNIEFSSIHSLLQFIYL